MDSEVVAVVANEQAFSAAYCVGPNDDLYPPTPGMTLRDWFAGQALPAVITAMQSDLIGDHHEAGGGPNGFAAIAYDIASAMLRVRAALIEADSASKLA